MRNLFIITIISFLFSCNEVYDISNSSTPSSKDTSYIITSIPAEKSKVVLVEEFTGVKCPNCPAGTKELNRLDSIFKEKITIIANHSNFLASPIETTDPDLRNESAESLYNLWGASSKPIGTIDRIKVNNKVLLSYSSWKKNIEDRLKVTSDINIESFITKDKLSDKYFLKVKLTFLKEKTTKSNLSISIIEDGIKATQDNNGIKEKDYIHKHVLRKMITNFKGDYIQQTNNTYEKGRVIEKTFEITPNIEWNINNCKIVCFVTNSSTEEVFQTNIISFK